MTDMNRQDARQKLPDGWRRVRLEEILLDARNGLYKPDEYYGSGVPILKMYNIGRLNGRWELGRIDRVRVSQTEENDYHLAKGDILLNRVNSRELVGKCAVVDETTANAVFESKNIRVRLRADTVDPLYVAAWLNSNGGRRQMEERLKQIVGQATINRSDLNGLVIPLPPLHEQQRIATILNEQMAAVERARAAAETRLKASKALPGAYLCAVFNRPEAQQWPRRRLDTVCEIQLGKMLSPKSKTGTRSRAYLRNANVQWNRFELSEVIEMDFTEEEEKKFALRPGDLLVCEGGEPGRAAVWSGQMQLCCYQKALHRLRPFGGCADPYFLLYRLWFGAVTDEFFESQAKTTIAHLPAVRLGSLLIGLPSIAGQQRVVATLSQQMAEAERVRKVVEEELAVINGLPAALLRRAFSGEL